MTDGMFTPEEQKILAVYRDPRLWGMGRATRLSVQYLLATGVLTYFAVTEREPVYSLIVYVALVAWVIVRLIKARRLAGVMPQILAKYEERIAQLEAASGATRT